jgi:hypothetical protein
MKKAMLLTAVAMLLMVPGPGRADTESAELAKYRPSVDRAVQRALAYMATRQQPDGSFDGGAVGRQGYIGRINATVALPGMAFLSAGHTPGRGPYGDVVNRCHNSEKGGFDYQPGEGKASPPMSAVGLLCRELSGHHDDEVNRRCGDYLLGLAEGGALFTHPTYRMYTIYYASQAMFQLGGTHWERFAPLLYKHVLPQQATDGGSHATHYGRAYSTSMYVLALTVTCRQLPIYQR